MCQCHLSLWFRCVSKKATYWECALCIDFLHTHTRTHCIMQQQEQQQKRSCFRALTYVRDFTLSSDTQTEINYWNRKKKGGKESIECAWCHSLSQTESEHNAETPKSVKRAGKQNKKRRGSSCAHQWGLIDYLWLPAVPSTRCIFVLFITTSSCCMCEILNTLGISSRGFPAQKYKSALLPSVVHTVSVLSYFN